MSGSSPSPSMSENLPVAYNRAISFFYKGICKILTTKRGKVSENFTVHTIFSSYCFIWLFFYDAGFAGQNCQHSLQFARGVKPSWSALAQRPHVTEQKIKIRSPPSRSNIRITRREFYPKRCRTLTTQAAVALFLLGIMSDLSLYLSEVLT
jgi:hypothetical protein